MCTPLSNAAARVCASTPANADEYAGAGVFGDPDVGEPLSNAAA